MGGMVAFPLWAGGGAADHDIARRQRCTAPVGGGKLMRVERCDMNPETAERGAREMAAYERHRAELERKYPGRIALLHGDELLGVFKTWEKAVKMAWYRFGEPEPCYWQEIGKPVPMRPLWGPAPDEPPRPPEPPLEVKFAKELATYQRHRAALEHD